MADDALIPPIPSDEIFKELISGAEAVDDDDEDDDDDDDAFI